ncbi:hypothetical protein K438DRAFT_83358 [Mycena galopus ATCC 62051]|nr:hypothetical protein K438DRAFT_83358 [Mycena galopus ATCC 62051]
MTLESFPRYQSLALCSVLQFLTLALRSTLKSQPHLLCDAADTSSRGAVFTVAHGFRHACPR